MSPRRRIACARVANLPLAAEQRAHPELCGQPLAIAEGSGARAELLSVSPEAARAGVRRGSSVAHARSICAALVVRVASPALDRAARDALLDAALACAPRAALAPRDSGAFANEAAVFVDASGIGTLFRSEAGFATALAARIRGLGLPAEVAVASSSGVAHIAARQLGTSDTASCRSEEADARVFALAPERERAFLAPLPIDLHAPDDALAETLTRFGVHHVRDLLALPRRGLANRLGAGVLALIRLAEGLTTEAPLPEPRDARLVEAIDLEAPAERIEPLLFVLQGLLSRLLERLEARHLGCGDLALQLDLEGGGRDARHIGVAAPTADLRVLVRLIRHMLESCAIDAPVLGARIETCGRPLRRDQLDLFRPAGPAPAVLGETLAALQSLCGDARVGAGATAATTTRLAPQRRRQRTCGALCRPLAHDRGLVVARGALCFRPLRCPKR
jgi:protein ImuB